MEQYVPIKAAIRTQQCASDVENSETPGLIKQHILREFVGHSTNENY